MIIHDNEDFFDRYANFYGCVREQLYDYFFIDFIKKQKRRRFSLIDIGGGSGVFAKLVLDSCINADVTILDPSKVLLNKNIDDRINVVLGKLPNEIYLESKFDFIHVKEVFHHIVGSSIDESKKLLLESLLTIKNLLKKDGFLLIHELFYEGYYISTLSRTLIFYLLNFQNRVQIKIPAKEFLDGLKVVFYTRKEFISLLKKCGYKIIIFQKIYWRHNYKTKLLFLKNWGRMLFIAKKSV